MADKKHFFGIIKPTRDDFITNPIEEDNKIMREHFHLYQDMNGQGLLSR